MVDVDGSSARSEHPSERQDRPVVERLAKRGGREWRGERGDSIRLSAGAKLCEQECSQPFPPVGPTSERKRVRGTFFLHFRKTKLHLLIIPPPLPPEPAVTGMIGRFFEVNWIEMI